MKLATYEIFLKVYLLVEAKTFSKFLSPFKNPILIVYNTCYLICKLLYWIYFQ